MYKHYDSSIEVFHPREGELIQEICDSILNSGRMAFEPRSHATRIQHAKSHGVLKGKLVVPELSEPYLRQGLFAKPNLEGYDIIVRFSTGHSNCRSDVVPSPRAMSIKVLGAGEQKAVDSDQSKNQDFLLVNRPDFFPDVETYARVQKHILERQPHYSDCFLRLGSWLSITTQNLFALFGSEAPLLIRAFGDRGYHILGQNFHSMAAIRFGNYIAKLCAFPASQSLQRYVEKPIPSKDNALREGVVEFFNDNDAAYTLCAQLCTDLKKTPVEDASRKWREKDSRFHPIARIELPRQRADSPARRYYADENLSFDSWRCLEDHRPLGSIMRLRKRAYQLSSEYRHKMNASRAVEPIDISELPD